jgi:hypothetical protein
VDLAGESLRKRGKKWVQRAFREAGKFPSPIPGLLDRFS